MHVSRLDCWSSSQKQVHSVPDDIRRAHYCFLYLPIVALIIMSAPRLMLSIRKFTIPISPHLGSSELRSPIRQSME